MTEPQSPSPAAKCHGLLLLSQLASPGLKELRDAAALDPNGSATEVDDSESHDTKSQASSIDHVTVTIPKRPTRRMDKTLGKIALGFTEIFASRVGQDINLSDAAKELEVERRRIYDIVNVFESLEVVRRKAKNIYIYQGLANLDLTLGKLKALAPTQIDSPQKPVRHVARTQHSFQTDSEEWKPRSDRSLGVLTQRFIMMFMESQDLTVSLEAAADRLIYGRNCPDDKKNKNQLRRLYDIANILISLDLVERDTMALKGRTRFIWRGKRPQELPDFQAGSVMRPENKAKRNQKQTLLKVIHSPAKSPQPRPKRSKSESSLHTPPSQLSNAETPNPSRVLPFSFPKYHFNGQTPAQQQPSTSMAQQLVSPALASAMPTPSTDTSSSSELVTPLMHHRRQTVNHPPLAPPNLDTTPQQSTRPSSRHDTDVALPSMLSPTEPHSRSAPPTAPPTAPPFQWPSGQQVYMLPEGSPIMWPITQGQSGPYKGMQMQQMVAVPVLMPAAQAAQLAATNGIPTLNYPQASLSATSNMPTLWPMSRHPNSQA
eukprot:TRINITY_DN5039_c0_g1_i1.p1 TRINITY_DN5039_c0_g1~~TRINITY_DN5039_c0_g1_i1.p1  ORF type:complete len:544 (+),score=67.69 TRINITY_DN5039_c0_g1_i1:35-1666(+)